ncbi:hypothetical protein SmedWSM1115_06670 [Sinorhizobium medicae WSM1115]|nr:hypothetical protein [Sinorhizobium medicae]MBO1962277.1 hypothetical protein [Sinorhizobium medicae]UFX03332.1 hypothetical protein SmedWSM1115_06670 [Sinorhizobium medicae WSM1115]UWU09364.1 hypothetical protein N2598_06365 [Sinorhizobium medicae]
MAQQAEFVRQTLKRLWKRHSDEKVSIVGVVRFSRPAPLWQESEDDAGENQGGRPEVCRLIPAPFPNFIAFKMRRRQLCGNLEITFLAAVEVPGGKCETNDKRQLSGRDRHEQQSDDCCDAKTLDHVTKPIEVSLNVTPGNVHHVAPSVTPTMPADATLTMTAKPDATWRSGPSSCQVPIFACRVAVITTFSNPNW